MPVLVKRHGDPPQANASPAQPPDFGQHGLLGRIGFDVFAARGYAVTELDVAHALAVGAFGVKCSQRPFAESLRAKAMRA